jgi:Proton-conducting membrane transporter/NADH-Ubiquinone oxidoreductase (complex I), chain 5 N-terminus/LAGLIDADG endonuclease
MYISIVFLPFLAAILSGFFGRALGAKGVFIINITCLAITTLLSFVAFYEVVLCNSPVTVELLSWVSSEQFSVTWSFYFDELTVTMLLPVTVVSILVHIYSVGYMQDDPHTQRFFSYISLFTGLMLMLVTANNFLVLFIGWEGVGICSYLLVHFWYTRVAAVKSGMNAMFTNRIGDYFLTIGFFALFFTFGTLDFATVFSLAPYINTNVITFIAVLLLLGASAKSAQLGLHGWLPYAMEGPTPVSSLIHASTMVDKNYLNKNKKRETGNNINPWFITGYSDGDSSFSIRIISSSSSKLGFYASIVYSLGAEANPENKKLLDLIKNYFDQKGSISKCKNMYYYEVSSVKDLKIIRNHFEKYELQSTKRIHFQLWCQVMDMIINKEHLTKEGLLRILSIKSVFPKGLTNKMKKMYPNINLYNKPVFKSNMNTLNPYWIAGFVQADGSFGLNYIKGEKRPLGYTCLPQFRLSQDERDLILLKRIIKTLKCGGLVKPGIDRTVYGVNVAKTKDLLNIIIPFFNEYSLYGAKLLDYKDFWKGMDIIKNKGHLNKEGLTNLKILAYQMNTFRKFE